MAPQPFDPLRYKAIQRAAWNNVASGKKKWWNLFERFCWRNPKREFFQIMPPLEQEKRNENDEFALVDVSAPKQKDAPH